MTTTIYPACVKCARPIRPRKSKAADHPDTVGHGAAGRCSGCQKRHLLRQAGPAESRRDPHAVIDDITFMLDTGETNPVTIARRAGYTNLRTLAGLLTRHGDASLRSLRNELDRLGKQGITA